MRHRGLYRHERAWRTAMAAVIGTAAVVGLMSLAFTPSEALGFGPTTPTLSAETVNSSIEGDAAYTHAGFGAAGLTVKRIFVENLQIGDEIRTVNGVPSAPLTIRTAAGSFFNALDVGQGNQRPSAAFFPDNPTLQWDTWLALGNLASFTRVGGPFPNVAQADGGDNVIDHTDMAWFNVPGYVTPDGRMLVGQFAFTEDSAFEITINITGKRGTEDLEFNGLTYSSGTFPDPIGACCVGLICSEIAESECTAAGGTFHGPDTLCSKVSCLPEPPDPIGACCLGESDTCFEVTEDDCAILGGVIGSVYHGDKTLCSDIDCDAEIPGACCVDGECIVVVQSLCTLAQGTFQGEDSLCADVDCNPPNLNGACCIFGECAEMTEEFCLLASGAFSGVGSTCDGIIADECANGPPTTGACCIAGECSVMTEALCAQSFGEFLELGTDCTDVTCPAVGACCIAGACLQLSGAICDLRGGLFADEGVPCDGVECELPAAVGTGCQGSFWMQSGFPRWPSPYRGGLLIIEVFDIPSCVTDWAIHGGKFNQTSSMSGGEGELNTAARQLMRAAIPALLNAQLTKSGRCQSDYPIGDSTLLIQVVNERLATCDPESIHQLADALGAYNSLGCPINRLGHCRSVNNHNDDD